MSYPNQPQYSQSSTSAGTIILIVVGLLAILAVALAICGGAAFFFFAIGSPVMDMAQPVAPSVVVQNEMQAEPVAEDIVANDPQGRREWAYQDSTESAGGRLQLGDGNMWTERRTDGASYSFTEKQRTPDFVELFDPSRGLYVRLYVDHMEWGRDGGNWTRGQTGAWQSEPLKQ